MWLDVRMRKLILVVFVLAARISFCEDVKERARGFLEWYDPIAQRLNAVANDADWKASTDVSDEHTGQRVGANEMRAAFTGNTYNIETAQTLLKSRAQLDPLVVKQLEMILFAAASYPGTLPEIVAQRVRA